MISHCVLSVLRSQVKLFDGDSPLPPNSPFHIPYKLRSPRARAALVRAQAVMLQQKNGGADANVAYAAIVGYKIQAGNYEQRAEAVASFILEISRIHVHINEAKSIGDADMTMI